MSMLSGCTVKSWILTKKLVEIGSAAKIMALALLGLVYMKCKTRRNISMWDFFVLFCFKFQWKLFGFFRGKNSSATQTWLKRKLGC